MSKSSVPRCVVQSIVCQSYGQVVIGPNVYRHCFTVTLECCQPSKIDLRSLDFCRAMLCISAAYVVMRCMSVCVSVTFMDCVKTNKHSINIFFTLG